MINRLLNAVASRSEETGERISDADLARAAKINQAAVKYWRDNPNTQLKAENVFLLADYLQVNARWLATGEGEVKNVSGYTDVKVTDSKILGEIATAIIRLQMIRDEVVKIIDQMSGLPSMLDSGVHSHDMNISSADRIRRDLEAMRELTKGRNEGEEHGKRRTKQQPSAIGRKNRGL